jgi:hypothetical protein
MSDLPPGSPPPGPPPPPPPIAPLPPPDRGGAVGHAAAWISPGAPRSRRRGRYVLGCAVVAPTAVPFPAAEGVDAEHGAELACEVIEPTLAGTELADASWVPVNRAGDVIASDQTPFGP